VSARAIDVKSLLNATGYKYVEVDEDLWKIPEIPHKGKNLKKHDLYLFANSRKKVLRVSLHLGPQGSLAGAAELEEKLKDVSKRFEPIEFVALSLTLIAVIEIPNDKLDKETLLREIEKLWLTSDQAYPEIARFIGTDRKESYGPGEGGGMGVGTGRGHREPNASNEPPTKEITSRPDTRPVLLNRVRPEYTDHARENKTQGTVRLRMLVDETGKVKQARIISGLPDGLNEKAIEAAYKMRFKPATKDGKDVATWIAIEVTFALR
jgi:TonB family protein